MIGFCWRTLAFVVALLAPAGSAHARPPHKQALADHYGPLLAKGLNDCRTCHMPDPPGAKEELSDTKPHNPFGARLKAVRDELRKADRKTDIATRLDAVAQEDSDGDGAPNVVELLTGHNPGDAGDKPSAAELARVPELLAAFTRLKTAYPWRPFEIVKRPALPLVKNAAWVRTPVDAFIAAEHETRGLTPRPEAPRAVLLRRVYLDLIGLPPTPEELHAFLADPSSNAYEKVVDRLLEDPRHGERWGRHWMDVWRYSDWAGYGAQVRDSQPHVWRWRDWIVEALNTDKGYDRILLEMLAADELAPEDGDALRATGYLVRNYKLLSREKWMQDTVDHTFQAFLGLKFGCARCHDHMYDPILQKEYYQVRAIFEPHNVRTDRLPGQPDTKKVGLVRAFDANPQVQTFLFIRGDDRTPDKTPLEPGVPEALGGAFVVESVALPQAAYAPDRRDFVVTETVAASQEALVLARRARATTRRDAAAPVLAALADEPFRAVFKLTAARKAWEAWQQAELEAPLAEARHTALLAALEAEQLEEKGKKDSREWTETATRAATAQRQAALLDARRVLLATRQAVATAPPKMVDAQKKKLADAEKTLAKAEEDAKRPAGTAYTKRAVTTYPTTSTGRRLALAKWIAHRDNPLTARVAMNHVWLRHFGQALVPSADDFGRNGKPPTHPALLDWLAAEFMERGWSQRAMHRLLVTSSTYRMASTPDEANAALDSDNRYLWRMTPRRLEAEAVRDGVFHVAGRLDLTRGGPEIDHTQGLTVPRRSIYFQHAAEKQMEFLQIFDGPDVVECYERRDSVMPQQALALANSELTLRHARLLARDLRPTVGADPAAFTAAAFERVLSRPPTGEELAECVAFLNEQTAKHGSPGKPAADTEGRLAASAPALRARENLVHVLMNHHEFVTLR